MLSAVVEDVEIGEIYVAGETVPAGTYRRLDTGRTLMLAGPDALPASLDGRVACYVRVASTWGQHMLKAA